MRRILKPKLLLPIVLLAALAAAYKLALAEPRAEAKPKVEGQVYVLPKEFLLNLTGERYAKLNVALVIEGEEPIQAEGHGTPPEGFGPLPQEAVVRDIVTDTLTDRSPTELVDREARRRIKQQLEKAIDRQTDVPVHEVLLTDVAIQ